MADGAAEGDRQVMVTEVAEGRSLVWDMFLKDKAHTGHIQRFWETEWPQIRRGLESDFSIHVDEDTMPHWVDVGKAVYWQRLLVREPVTRKDDDGESYRVLEDIDHGWQHTGALPANNASQIANYLKKGFRLRPPIEGVVDYDVEALEAAEPAEVPEDESTVYKCSQVHFGIPDRGTHRFNTWSGYIQHCARFNVPIEEQPPDDVIVRREGSRWFCLLHDSAFSMYRLAKRHVEHYMHLGKQHVDVKQMEVIHDKKGDFSDTNRAAKKETRTEQPMAKRPIDGDEVSK